MKRIEQLARIEQESKAMALRVPPAYWPASGTLSVENLSARYSPAGPKLLRKLNFEVKAGERIGIGAFTFASLLLALF